jgi:hypothetical protein
MERLRQVPVLSGCQGQGCGAAFNISPGEVLKELCPRHTSFHYTIHLLLPLKLKTLDRWSLAVGGSNAMKFALFDLFFHTKYQDRV